MHFGFKVAEKKMASWLSQKANRSETIREAIRQMMLRESAVDEPKCPKNRPKQSAHFVTPEYRVSRRRSFMRGKSGSTRFAQAKHMRRRRK